MRKRHTSTGFPTVVKRKNGKKVVIWRWYEAGPDGKSRERWKTLGLASRFKSDAAARQEAARLGLGRAIEDGPRTLNELADHWLETDDDPNERRAFSTRENYRGYLRKWIKPRWGDQALERVKAVAVEGWLSKLRKADGSALAPGSKKKIPPTKMSNVKSRMSLLLAIMSLGYRKQKNRCALVPSWHDIAESAAAKCWLWKKIVC
jgi:hypothetical protein